jgi:hypothetical protein
MNMLKYLEDACEGIDASIFSGDLLYDDERREMLKEYIGRWTRTITEHETEPPVIDEKDEDEP